jgi:hypothetical protein
MVLAEVLSPTHADLQPLIHRDVSAVEQAKLVVLMVFVRDNSRLNCDKQCQRNVDIMQFCLKTLQENDGVWVRVH